MSEATSGVFYNQGEKVEKEKGNTNGMESASPAEGLEQLLSLEEKIYQTIDLLKSTRAEKEELLLENERLRREREEQASRLQALEGRLARLDQEREAVRARVQRLLEQVDSLTNLRAGA